MHRQVALGCSEDNHTAGMPHQNRGARMGIMGVQLLDRHDLRTKLLDHLNYTIVQITNADRDVARRPARGAAPDYAGLQNAWASGIPFHNGVTGRLKPGVDTQNADSRWGSRFAVFWGRLRRWLGFQWKA